MASTINVRIGTWYVAFHRPYPSFHVVCPLLDVEQAEHVELKNAVARRDLVPAIEVEAERSGVLRTVRSGMLAVPSRCQQRLPGLTAHDVSEIDRVVRAVLTEVGTG